MGSQGEAAAGGEQISSLTWPDHLLSLDEWAGLPAQEDRHCELVDGVLLVSPRPSGRHQRAIARLTAELDAQLPDELTALPETELLIAEGPAATVRVPDILVTRFELVQGQDPRRFAAAEVVLAVEVVSPGSRSTDRVTEVAEYALAGIGCYWIVDLEAGAITVLEARVGTYVIRSEGRVVEVTRPARLHLDLAEVLARR